MGYDHDTAPLASKPSKADADVGATFDHSAEIADLKNQISALQENAAAPAESVESSFDSSELAALKATVNGLVKKS